MCYKIIANQHHFAIRVTLFCITLQRLEGLGDSASINVTIMVPEVRVFMVSAPEASFAEVY